MKAVLIPLMVLLVAAGCGDTADGGPSAAQSTGGSDLSTAVDGLCHARAAIKDSIGPSWRIFQNEAHDALHELAREVTPKSRSVAARLLEAKQRVEVAFVQDMAPDGFKKLLSQLLAASNAALEELDLETVECA